MAVHKHQLTTGTDHIVGTSGKDLFLAPLTGAAHKPTLTNKDRLDGGDGTDTISAALSGASLAPWLKNIEQAIFSRSATTALSLDLAHATALTSLSFKAFDSGVTVAHATHAATIAISNTSEQTIEVDGIDENTVSTEHLKFKNAQDDKLTLATAGGGDFNALNVSLSNSSVELQGNSRPTEITIHSNGHKQNDFYAHTSTTGHDVENLTISGKAALNLWGLSVAFTSLASVSAANMHGALIAEFGGANLTSVATGSGNDAIILDSLGGTTANKGTVDLGAGDDDLVMSHSFAFDATTQTFVGGDGTDTVDISGNVSDLSSLFSGFEHLSVANATGTYNLGSEWTAFSFDNDTASTDQVVVNGSSLTAVTGSSDKDYFAVTALGGAAGSKAVVDLQAGDDFLDVTNLALNSSTQSFEGGDGNDGFVIKGNVANLSALFHGFEYTYIDDATGTYDFGNSGINGIILGNTPVSSVSFNNVQSGGLVQILGTQAEFMTVNVENAASLHNESFRFQLAYTADFGNSTVGLFAPNLSNLFIDSFANHHTMYLSTVGAATDTASVTITGDGALTLNATNASTSYISELTITNTAGVDISGLANGTQAFVSSGATIVGGDGDDILVGGAGSDTISTGGGNNTVHGSLGTDVINLTANSGLDVIAYDAVTQSPFSSADTVNNFGILDSIDISGLVSSVNFAGNYVDFSSGTPHLSHTVVMAFYDTTNDHLYVDLNHDGSIDAAHDLDIKLDISTFNSWNITA